MRKEQQKIGVFGGAFDPVHEGHLELARQASNRCGLDRVLFVPTMWPPHKPATGASFDQRVAMLTLALAREKDMEVSLVEGERQGPSYTVDTLTILSRRLDHPDLFLIMGADSLLDFPRWYRFDRLLAQAALIVGARRGISLEQLHEVVQTLPGPFVFDGQARCWRGPVHAIYLLEQVQQDIASSRLRQELAAGRPVTGVPGAVIRYIRENRLYQRNVGAS